LPLAGALMIGYTLQYLNNFFHAALARASGESL
jgi:hypothetical protein